MEQESARKSKRRIFASIIICVGVGALIYFGTSHYRTSRPDKLANEGDDIDWPTERGKRYDGYVTVGLNYQNPGQYGSQVRFHIAGDEYSLQITESTKLEKITAEAGSITWNLGERHRYRAYGTLDPKARTLHADRIKYMGPVRAKVVQ